MKSKAKPRSIGQGIEQFGNLQQMHLGTPGMDNIAGDFGNVFYSTNGETSNSYSLVEANNLNN